MYLTVCFNLFLFVLGARLIKPYRDGSILKSHDLIAKYYVGQIVISLQMKIIYLIAFKLTCL